MKIGSRGAGSRIGKSEAGKPKQTGQAIGQTQEQKTGQAQIAHGERQSVGGRVRWKSMGWPQWGHRTLGGLGVGLLSGWVL